MKRGQWHDVSTRILSCNFDELINFVEIETAWMQLWSKEDRVKYNLPKWFSIKQWRCPEAGIDHLKWASSLVMDESMGVEKDSPDFGVPTYQAIVAAEILKLYQWWKVDRPGRPDPYDVSGWTEICARRRADSTSIFHETAPDKAESRAALDICTRIENEYEAEDTDMLIRLMKIRNGLWT